MKKEMGKRIQNIRESMGATKEAFAKEIGISGQYLGLIEHGKNCLSIEKLKALCDFTNTTADYILFGKDENILSNTKRILKEYTDEQINAACDALKNLSSIIRAN